MSTNNDNNDDKFALGNVTADIERGLVEMGRRFPLRSINVSVSAWQFNYDSGDELNVDWTLTASPTIGTKEEIIQAAFKKSLDAALNDIDRQLNALPLPKSEGEINAELQAAADADRGMKAIEYAYANGRFGGLDGGV